MKQRATGFTLIEILIVLVIISIVSSAAILSLHINQQARMAALAKRLSLSFMLAETEAMLQTQVLGWAYSAKAFQFYQYTEPTQAKEQAWKPVTVKALRLQNIPSDLQLTLILEDKTVGAVADLQTAEPELIIPPSGDITPFTLLIGKKGEQARYQVIGEGNGRIYSAPLP